MVPDSFMWVTEMFVTHGPTPAVWPNGGTLSSAGGPCLSEASWTALPRLTSVRSNEARRGVNGFGTFCRNKRASPAGAKPGNTENSVDTMIWWHKCDSFNCQHFFRGKTQDRSPIKIVKL